MRFGLHLGHYYPYYWGYYHNPFHYLYERPGYYYRQAVQPMGAFDLNVRPKKAEVWVDGNYIGTAGKYDGYPDYLWLAEGEHRLVFYLEGYGTVVRDVETLVGIIADINMDLAPGESVRPEEYVVERPEPQAESGADDYASRPVRRPARDYRERRAPRDAADAADENGRDADSMDVRQAPGRLVVQVEPADASVYLDGRFLGTGRDLARLHSGLIVDAGDHLLEIVRPGYDTREVEFEVAAGEEEEIRVSLDAG